MQSIQDGHPCQKQEAKFLHGKDRNYKYIDDPPIQNNHKQFQSITSRKSRNFYQIYVNGIRQYFNRYPHRNKKPQPKILPYR